MAESSRPFLAQDVRGMPALAPGLGVGSHQMGDPVLWARQTIALETEALATLEESLHSTSLGERFDAAIRTILGVSGHVVVSGIGKSGIVARKVSATLASTGTPSLFVHAADAGHGDLGTITRESAVVLFSWSGETAELSTIILYCRRFGIPLIAVTSRADSTLGEQADISLILPQVREACPNRLAPTCTTTVQLVLGDALAVSLMRMRGFSSDDFKVFHPAGMLAAQLLKVSDVMATGDLVPRVDGTATLLDAIVEMSQKRFGVTAIVDGQNGLIGAFSDGDVRRSIAVTGLDATVADHMNPRPHHVPPTMLISEAVALMNEFNINQLFVCRDDRLIGIVHLHTLLRTGVM